MKEGASYATAPEQFRGDERNPVIIYLKGASAGHANRLAISVRSGTDKFSSRSSQAVVAREQHRRRPAGHSTDG